jgi:transposase
MAYRSVWMTDKREVVRRLRAGDSIKRIRRELGLSRNTVRRYKQRAAELGLLTIEKLPGHEEFGRLWEADEGPQAPSGPPSIVEHHAEVVDKLLERGVDASVIHQLLVEEHDFEGSYSSVQRFVKRRKDAKQPELTVRVETPPGQEAQVDFGFLGYLRTDRSSPPRKSWLFVMVLSHSRHVFARIVHDQSAATWQDLHRRAFEFFGGVPHTIVPDNLRAAIVRSCYDDPEAQRGFRECAEHYGFAIRPARVRKPKDKGKVERVIQYIRRAFWKARDFELIGDANHALERWLVETAGMRVHGTTGQRPLETFGASELGALLPLPEQPWEPREYAKAKVHPDSHVRFAKACYSVPCRLIGKQVLVQATARQVVVFFGYDLVASHIKVGPKARQTHPDHIPPAKLRFYTQNADWCRERAQRIGPYTAEVIETLLSKRPVDRLRSVQGILALAERHGDRRLEAACHRALFFGDISRKTIKSILDKGLDMQSLEGERRVEVLPFARFTRSAAEIFGTGGQQC